VARRLARDYLKPQAPRIAASVLCMLVVASATGLIAWLLEPAIRTIFIERRADMLVLIPLAVLAVSAIKAVAAYGQGVLMADVARNLVTGIQKRLFARLMYADLARLSEKHSGVHQTNFLQNTSMIANAVSTALVGVFRDVPTMIGLIFVMFLMDWQLALVATIVTPLVALLTRRLSKVASKSMSGSIRNTNELAKRIAETLQGIRIVKAYGRVEHEVARAAHLIDERMRHYFKAQRASIAAAPLTEAVAGIGIAGVIYYGGARGLWGALTLSQFMTFFAAMMMAFQPMRTLSNLATVGAQGVKAAEALFEELDIEPTIKDAADARKLVSAHPAGALVRFADVSFAYGQEIPALSHISLEAQPGETIALVGPSGAGKTTILNLLLRFYEPNSGTIAIDGQSIGSLTIASLRDAIALVAQDATLFDDTIAANIAYGARGGRQASDQEIKKAAELAAADEFIARMPHGYNTRVGEDGSQLSGGQRQRIAIARAFLKDAPILLLDEATSALDTHSEQQVQAALSQLMRGRTTFVIAHRLSTILTADRIYVLQAGRVIEVGTHTELLRRAGLYASLYERQFQGGAKVSDEPLAIAGE
jgi:subfamily B ATP-binding cassette protein MsbA